MAMKITFNGREYGSLDEMPPEERQSYERVMSLALGKGGKGVPGRLGFNMSLSLGKGGQEMPEGLDVKTSVSTSVKTRILVNGRECASVSELPPEVRRAYEQATASPAAGKPLRTPAVPESLRRPGSGGAPGVPGILFRALIVLAAVLVAVLLYGMLAKL